MADEAKENKIWNAYIDKYSNEPLNMSQLHDFAIGAHNPHDSIPFKIAAKILRRNKGKGKVENLEEKKDNSEEKDIATDSAELWKDIEYRMSRGDIEYIKKLFQLQKVSMNDTNKFEETLFLLSCRKGQYEIASMCLLLGCDINKRDKKNRDAIKLSIYANSPHIEQLVQIRKIGSNEIGNKISEISNLLSNQNGKINILIKSLQTVISDENNMNLFIDNLTHSLIATINQRLAFSDDLLMLVWIYKVEILKMDAYDTQMWNIIYATAKEIISSYPIHEIDFFWLNNYLLKSSLWYYKVNGTDMLFLQLLNIVQSAADKQKQMFLIDPFTHLYETKRALWDQLMSFNFKTDPGRYALLQNKTIARQDCIPFGQTSEYERKELITNITPSMTFSPLSYYAIEIYLPKLVLLGHILNDSFQLSIRNIFDINVETGLNLKLSLKYKRGPLKQLLRCKQKSQNDYANEKFPQSCHVLDINRCSLIFDNVESLLNGLQIFYDKMVEDKSGSIVGIVRVKNGFNNDEYKFELSNVNYADIKLNVMIYLPKIAANAIIGEVQFLLKDMMNFKNEAHRMYNIIRQEEFIHDINTILPLMSDNIKQLHTNACIGNHKGISKIMIENQLNYAEIMRKNAKNKTVIYDACKNRQLRVLRFFYKLSQNNNENSKDFLDKLFDDNNGIQSFCAVEMAVDRGTYDLNKFLTTIKGLCDRIISDDERMHRVLNYLFRIDNWSIFLLWKQKLKIDRNVLLKFMSFGLSLVRNGKLKVVTANMCILYGRNIFHMITENGNANMTIKLVEWVIDECEYDMSELVQIIFTPDGNNRNVIERCVQRDNFTLLKYLFTLTELVSDFYKKDKRLFHRLLGRVILSANEKIWNFIQKTFAVTSAMIKNNFTLDKAANAMERELTNELPNLYKNSSKNSGKLRGIQYYDKNLFYFVYFIDRFELMREKLTDSELFKLLFDSDMGWRNMSAIEWAFYVNKTQLIEHIFKLDIINQKIKNEKRLLYRMLANCVSARTNEMFETMIASLNVEHKLFIEFAENVQDSRDSYLNTNLFHFICFANKQFRLKRFRFLFEILYNNDSNHCIHLLLKPNNKKVTPILSFMQSNEVKIIEFVVANTDNHYLSLHINEKYNENKSKFSKFAKYISEEKKEETLTKEESKQSIEFDPLSFIEHKSGKNSCVCLTAPHGMLRTPQQKQIFLNRADLENTNVAIKTLSDLNTMQMVYEISQHLRELQKSNENNPRSVIEPGYVVLKVNRTYLDGNRSVEQLAFCPNDTKAKSVFESYSDSINQEINRMKTENETLINDRNERMLLLDIHGQAKKEFTDTICVGTKSGQTTNGNENKQKILASLFKPLREELKWVNLVGMENDNEFKAYSGGYTVRNYSEKSNVYGIQLEFGSNLRKVKEKRIAVAKAIAKGILEIHKNGIYKI